MATPEGLIEGTVRVTSVQGEWMTVEKISSDLPCIACTASCPSGFLHRLQINAMTRWRTPHQHAARPGDVWRVGVDPASLLQGAVRVYVLPLTGLLAGAILGNGMTGDTGAVLGSLAGLALSLCCLWRFPPASRDISLVFIKKIHSA